MNSHLSTEKRVRFATGETNLKKFTSPLFQSKTSANSLLTTERKIHMKKYYKDFYGCTASIKSNRDGTYSYRVCDGWGKLLAKGQTCTERGARIAIGRLSDSGWREVK